MVSKAAKKCKKPLQTTLGKASTSNDKEVDLSHVQQPIHTNIFGLRQVLTLFETATEEVQNYIAFECDIMYECRICRTIFRSLANFILHKRNYCQARYSPLGFSTEGESQVTSEGNTINTEPIDIPEHSPKSNKGLVSVIEKLKEKQNIVELNYQALNEDLSTKENNEHIHKSIDNKQQKDIILEKISSNNAAVFQTVFQDQPEHNNESPEFMRSQVMEIHGILDSNEVVLGQDGKICNFETNKLNENPNIPKNNWFCIECNVAFSTRKTLSYHIKCKHNNTRLVYLCPDCKETYATVWGVYRHLMKVHRKTTVQIRRMRQQIHNSIIRKDQEPAKKKDKKCEKTEKADDENQWLNDVEEDNYFQMCGGCGKRFERKAALQSHVQMCTKRLAVCNNIKENNAKKKEEGVKDSKSKTNKVEKAVPTGVLKGSSKRKPYLLRQLKPVSENTSLSTDKGIVNSVDEVCDVNANSKIYKENCDNEELNYSITCDNQSEATEASVQEEGKSEDIFVLSPSVENIDKESMLNIIGITNPDNDLHSVCKSEKIEQVINKRRVLKRDKAIVADEFNPLWDTLAQYMKEQNPNGHLDNISSSPENQIMTSAEQISDLQQIVAQVENIKLNSTQSDILENLNLLDSDINNQNYNQDPGRCNTPSLLETDYYQDEHFSETIKANISPKILCQIGSHSVKRKRSASLEEGKNKLFKTMGYDLLLDNQDEIFIKKIAPYINSTNFLCISCQISYPTYQELLWHMSAHFSWFRFQCSRCTFVSFSKSACVEHAIANHDIAESSIPSVVLPIPEWKIVLMSHDFEELTETSDFVGKHTDEVITDFNEEPIVIKDDEDENVCVAETVNLFVDSENKDNTSNEVYAFPIIEEHFAIKNESINIVDEDKDSFQIEIPQEIYSDVFEVICVADEDEKYNRRSGSPTNIISDVDKDDFIPIEAQDNSLSINTAESHYLTLVNNHLPIDEIFPTKVESQNDVQDLAHYTHLNYSEDKLDKVLLNNDSNAVTFIPTKPQEDPTRKIISEDTNADNPIPPKSMGTENVAEQPASDMNSEDNNADHFTGDCKFNVPQKIVNPTINDRPTRNRTKSKKTLQDDFFYDLNKVIKLNDSSLSKSQKQKKANNTTTNKNSKESTATSKGLRVYHKKK